MADCSEFHSYVKDRLGTAMLGAFSDSVLLYCFLF